MTNDKSMFFLEICIGSAFELTGRAGCSRIFLLVSKETLCGIVYRGYFFTIGYNKTVF
jgi:hypothetical protein